MSEYRVEGTLYITSIDKRTNTVSIRSCHPYDDQHYHWARRSERTGNWLVYRKGETISCLSKSMTEEQMARELNKLDSTLRPIMCYN